MKFVYKGTPPAARERERVCEGGRERERERGRERARASERASERERERNKEAGGERGLPGAGRHGATPSTIIFVY